MPAVDATVLETSRRAPRPQSGRRSELVAPVAAVLLAVAVVACGSQAPVAVPPAPSSAGAPGSSASGLPDAGASQVVVVPSPPATPATPAPIAETSPSPTPTWATWQPDAAFVQAKDQGRVILSGGKVRVVAQAPSPVQYPAALSLDTSWTRLMQEPPRVGVDDAGRAYTDYNYALLCGPGAAAVVLYYWPATRRSVTTRAGWFVEPVSVGPNRYARTYWKPTDPTGYGRGEIMYLAEVEWPVPDRGLPWWSRPGLMNWSAKPPSTDIWTLADAINWEASGGTDIHHFYVIQAASDLTMQALADHIHSDIAAGVPVVIAARTSDGSVALPFWSVRSTQRAVNHYVTVVGYDDTAGTYTLIDTCGPSCNDRNMRAGRGIIRQSALFSLIGAESDNDGIIW